MLADSPTKYMQNQECTDFIAQIPTVYDEVIPLCGKLGEYVAVAKRKGNKWYIAAMNNWQERDIMIDLSLIKSAGDWGLIKFLDSKVRPMSSLMVSMPTVRLLIINILINR